MACVESSIVAPRQLPNAIYLPMRKPSWDVSGTQPRTEEVNWVKRFRTVWRIAQGASVKMLRCGWPRADSRIDKAHTLGARLG